MLSGVMWVLNVPTQWSSELVGHYTSRPSAHCQDTIKIFMLVHAAFLLVCILLADKDLGMIEFLVSLTNTKLCLEKIVSLVCNMWVLIGRWGCQLCRGYHRRLMNSKTSILDASRSRADNHIIIFLWTIIWCSVDR